MENLKTARKKIEFRDGTVFPEDNEGLDPLEEDQLNEELLIEDIDEVDESFTDEPRPSPSTVNMASTETTTKRRRNAPDCRSPKRSTPNGYKHAHTTGSKSDSKPNFFTYDDRDHDAVRPLPFRPSRPVGVDLPTVTRVLRSTTAKLCREMEFFLLFFTEVIIADICKFTNDQGLILAGEKRSYADSEGGWNEVTPEELKRFIGVIIYMGVVRLPDVNRYWSSASLHHGLWARAFMTRDRFNSIMAALHLVDPNTEDNGDGLHQLRYLLDHIKSTCISLYQPSRNINVDERMFRAKSNNSGFKRFIKDKPTRWGFKLWVLAASDSGYILDFTIYTGSPGGRVIGLSKKVVLELVQPLVHQGYNVWLDNFYTSPDLLMELKKLGCNSCGTSSTNRLNFPSILRDYKQWARRSNRGDMRWCRIEGGNVLAIQWRDTRVFTCLSSFHNANESTTVERLIKTEGCWTRAEVRQPTTIYEYNRHVGGVDKYDQRIGTYHLLKSTKWWKTLFFHFIDIAITNSFLIYQEWRRKNSRMAGFDRCRNYSNLTFRENLCRQLAGIELDANVPLYDLPGKRPPNSSFHTIHLPAYTEKPMNCFLCYRTNKIQRKTLVTCHAPECERKSFCMIPNRGCFQMWHSSHADEHRSTINKL